MKLYSKQIVLLVSLAMVVSFTSCKSMILNAASTGISSSNQNGVPSKVKEKETEYKDPSILNNAELIDLYKNILLHINYLNENIINLDEGGESNE